MTEFHASDTVGGYRLEARLGGGGFGTVWRARRVSDGQVVALKLMPDAAGGDDLRLRADVELLAASAAAKSAHVVRVLGGGIEPVPYVVMEFIQGTNLGEELRLRQRLPQAEVIEIGLSIADALNALSEAGIVHRDVKPSNVMIDRGGVVKLADFGIAKIAGFDAVTLTGQLPLSIAYAAPEVWEGRAEHRSDLYAFAIVLYQCLTGSLPFRGAYAELFYQHRSVDADLSALPPDTAPSLLELIRTCLAKSPADRPEAAAVCTALLQQAKAEIGVPPLAVAAQAHEPDRFGPWLRAEAVPGRQWSWYCRHESSDDDAIVEVHFADSVQYGEALRRAVAANQRLAPLGAERLLQTSRLILRPDEAWHDPPAAAFQFWIAREDVELPQTTPQLSPRVALRAVESLIALIEAADEEGVPLELTAGELSLLPDGSIYLKHPGFPKSGLDTPERQALAYLRSLPLTRDTRPSIARAASLDDARRSLALLTSVRDLVTAPSLEPAGDPASDVDGAIATRRTPQFALIAGAAVLGVLAAVAVALLLLGNDSDGGGRANAQPTAVQPTPDNPALAACVALKLPAPLSAAEAVCGGIATMAFDPSCPRGQACNAKQTGTGVSLGINDRAVAFIDDTGNLAVAREDGSEPAKLTNHGRAQQPSWSPDGRYLAYLVVLPAPAAAAPQAGTTPAPQTAPTAPQGPLFVTQLHVIEVDRPANQGVLLASGAAPGTPAGLQRYASWPQWSLDGKTLFFLSTPISQPGGALFGVEVPRRGDDVNFGLLRSDLPSTETTLPTQLVALSLTGGDFGQPQSYLGRFTLRPNGELVVQVCDGDRTRLSCGLGRWDGRPVMYVATTRDRVYEPPVSGADGAYSFVREPNGSGGLVRIGPDGTVAPLELKPAPAGEPADGAWFAVRPQLAVTRRGDALLAPTAAATLGGIRLTDGASSPWRAGSSPAWFIAGLPSTPAVSSPPIVPFVSPTAEPNPTVTPVPAAPVVRFMTLNLTARRAGTVLPGATIIALVGTQECARGTTDSTGRLTLTVPGVGAATACSTLDAQIRFRVNGILVEESVPFRPQNVSSPTLNLP
ncbi:MAG TPA: protein kinase [Dehalococcoidia bacterium]|nr:protein kinase [Dehalococcoidia bacterium]